MQVLRLTIVGLLAALLFAPSSFAAARTKPNISFFSGQQDDAHWTPLQSSDGDRMSFELEVGSYIPSEPQCEGFAGCAGFEFSRVEGTTPPAREPYFFHKEDRDSPQSGGSPRLHIFLDDGGSIYLRPDDWTQNWRRVGEGDGDGNWDSFAGACTFQYDVSYQDALACHPGALVTEVEMVTDSNWMADKMGGYTAWVDQVQYNDFVYSHASDNNNSPAG